MVPLSPRDCLWGTDSRSGRSCLSFPFVAMALQWSLSRSCNAGPRITKIRRTPCMPLLSSLPLDPKLTLEQARGSSLRARQTEIRHNRVPTSPCRWDQLTGRSMGLPRAGRRPRSSTCGYLQPATCGLWLPLSCEPQITCKLFLVLHVITNLTSA
jgi:hypothetical protein